MPFFLGQLCKREGAEPFFWGSGDVTNKSPAAMVRACDPTPTSVNDAVSRLKKADRKNDAKLRAEVAHVHATNLSEASKRMLDCRYAGIVTPSGAFTPVAGQIQYDGEETLQRILFDKFVTEISKFVPVEDSSHNTKFRGHVSPFDGKYDKETFKRWFETEAKTTNPTGLPVDSYFAFVHSPDALFAALTTLGADINFVIETDKTPYIRAPSKQCMIAKCPPKKRMSKANPLYLLATGTSIHGIIFASDEENTRHAFNISLHRKSDAEIIVTYVDYAVLLLEIVTDETTKRVTDALRRVSGFEAIKITHCQTAIEWPSSGDDIGPCAAVAYYRHMVLLAFPDDPNATKLNTGSAIQLINLLHNTPLQIARTGYTGWVFPNFVLQSRDFWRKLFDNMRSRDKLPLHNMIQLMVEKPNGVCLSHIGNSAVTLLCNSNTTEKFGFCAPLANFTDRAVAL